MSTILFMVQYHEWGLNSIKYIVQHVHKKVSSKENIIIKIIHPHVGNPFSHIIHSSHHMNGISKHTRGIRDTCTCTGTV